MMAQDEDEEITVNQYLFRSYKKRPPPSPPRAEEHCWPLAGAFPSEESVDHVFADDSCTDESSNDRQRKYIIQGALDAVKEESSKASMEAQVLESSAAEKHSSNDRYQRESQQTPIPQFQLDVKTNGTSSSGVSDLTFPNTLYNNLSKKRGDQELVMRDRNYSPSPLSNPVPQAHRSKHRNSPGPDMEETSSPFIGTIRQPERPMSSMEPIKDDLSVFETVTSGIKRNLNKRGTYKSYAVAHSSSNPASLLKNYFVALEQRRLMHKLTAHHLRVVDSWFLFAPSISLTLLTGVVIFVFETTLNVETDGRVYAAIIAGITAFISVFWQALSRQLDLGTQGALHETAAGAFQKLSADIILTISSAASDDSISEHYASLVATKFDQGMAISPPTVPHVLESAFAAVSHRLDLMLNPPVHGKKGRKKRLQNVELIRLYANAYGELASEILHHWAWPIAFPQPRTASERAICSFALVVTEGRRSNRNGWIEYLFPSWKGLGKPRKNLYDVFPTSSSVSVGDQDSVSVYHTPQRKALIQQSPYRDEV